MGRTESESKDRMSQLVALSSYRLHHNSPPLLAHLDVETHQLHEVQNLVQCQFDTQVTICSSLIVPQEWSNIDPDSIVDEDLVDHFEISCQIMSCVNEETCGDCIPSLLLLCFGVDFDELRIEAARRISNDAAGESK